MADRRNVSKSVRAPKRKKARDPLPSPDLGKFRPGSLADFFANSPLRESGLKLPSRKKDRLREPDLE